MASFQQQENMLLTEHFSWPPISLIDDIINTINEVLYRCTDTFATGIASAPPQLLGFADRYAAEARTPGVDANGDPVFPDAALELDEGVLKLETLMENAVDKNFDKLEIWTLRNVLCLPRGEEELARWVRLAHYAGLDVQGEGEGDGKRERWTPETLYALRRKLIETQKLNAALLAEKRRNEALLAQLKALLNPGMTGVGVKSEDTTAGAAMESTVQSSSAGNSGAAFAFLTHTPSSQSLGVLPITASTSTSTTTPATATATAIAPAPPTTQTPLATHSSFTTSHLPHLRHLLSTLRPHLSSTSITSASTSTSTSTSQDRKTYLESQSKRILERRGVDTKDGVEGAVEGGRVRGDEVRGLEALVAAGGFGRGRGVGGGNGNGDGKGVGGDTEGEEGEGMDLS